MEFKWLWIAVAVIFVGICVEMTLVDRAKETTKQAAIKAIEQGADAETINRILNK